MIPKGGYRFSEKIMLKQNSSQRVRLTRAFFDRSVHEVAPELIGATLLVDGVGGTIVEVEAYHHTDPAAHSYRGRTERNAVMFGPPGSSVQSSRSTGLRPCAAAASFRKRGCCARGRGGCAKLSESRARTMDW